MRRMYLLIMLTVMVLGMGCSRDGLDFNEGLLSLGSVEMTQEQFREKLNKGEDFTLPNDIILYDWVSITEFKGKLDGNNKTLTIGSFEAGAVGLIKTIASGGQVKNLKIKLVVDFVYTLSKSQMGVLAGENEGSIENVHVTIESGKKVEGRIAGGLVGYNYRSGTIKKSSVRGYVSGTGIDSEAGGLVGWSNGRIEESFAIGYVSGDTAGGLVGYSFSSSTIEASYAKVAVTGTGEGSKAGGLVADNDEGTITNSYATRVVVGTEKSSQVGGLVGYNNGPITNSYARGVVIGGGKESSVGGLVGNNRANGKLENSFVLSSALKPVGRGSDNGVEAIAKSAIKGTTFSAKGWDPTVWVFVAGKWPKLKWEPSRQRPGGQGPQALTCPDRSYTAVKTEDELKEKLEANESVCLTDSIRLTVWESIEEFSGKLDGNNKTLTLASFTTGAVGLIKTIESGAQVKDLSIELEVDLVNSSTAANIYIGVLAGENKGSIENVHVRMAIGKKVGGSNAGGLVGSNDYGGTIKGSRVIGNVEATGDMAEAGGLVGFNDKGKIEESHAEGAVSASGSRSRAGGLVGYNDGTIENSYAKGAVSADGQYDSRAGGLVGYNDKGKIEESHAKGAVSADGLGSRAGGLVGWNDDGKIENSYAKGDVSADGIRSIAGGLVGYNDKGKIEESHAEGKVDGYDAGGLVAWNYRGTITNSYATGAVEGESAAGGLVGVNSESTITNSYATGDVSGPNAGGLVGYNDGTIENSYAEGDVRGEYFAGGLVGWNDDGTIENSYATGNVEGQGSAGGLVGENSSSGTITNSYATGAVSGPNAGGLVGLNSATITNSYATGDVSGHYAGGLVGRNWGGTIENSYATGAVTGEGDAGGLVGWNDDGTITNSFCLDRSGLNAVGSGSASGVRKIEQTDIRANTFTDAGWSRSVWKNLVAGQWPKLSWQP